MRVTERFQGFVDKFIGSPLVVDRDVNGAEARDSLPSPTFDFSHGFTHLWISMDIH